MNFDARQYGQLSDDDKQDYKRRERRDLIARELAQYHADVAPIIDLIAKIEILREKDGELDHDIEWLRKSMVHAMRMIGANVSERLAMAGV
jgi:ribosomal 50S subunit-associated protein YjgA (DUF615 family)